MSSTQRVTPYSALQIDTIVELLEKIYAEEIRLKGRIKTLEQQLSFSKAARTLSPITPADMEGSMEETGETPTVGAGNLLSFTETAASPFDYKLEVSRIHGVMVRTRILSTNGPENP